jgi:hypothetical protein
MVHKGGGGEGAIVFMIVLIRPHRGKGIETKRRKTWDTRFVCEKKIARF